MHCSCYAKNCYTTLIIQQLATFVIVIYRILKQVSQFYGILCVMQLTSCRLNLHEIICVIGLFPCGEGGGMGEWVGDSRIKVIGLIAAPFRG